jgi:hypothetical protein
MGEIKQAIEEFIQKRLAVYGVDPQQIVRDTRAAERATKDHTGRWLFELLQNCDDAGASEVRVLVEDDAVYVADNGRGLKPKAVSALCGTDFSDKTTGTIGRKGVGFKSVYEVSCNPQVFIVNGEGIEFSKDKTKKWLRQNGLDDSYVPYQWIPFFFSWDEARLEDRTLDSLAHYRTVVKLVSPVNIQNVKQLLKEWPPHALFAFRHVRQNNAPDLKIMLIPRDGTWEMNDSRGETPTLWRVSKHTEKAPEELLELLGADERQAVLVDGVGFLVAAPLENDCVAPTKDYLPIHVFYPTEQKGPLRLLLHAEFLVKSDRTALMPVNGSPFNAWVAERLAHYICVFVNNAYRPDKPSGHAALLVTFGDRESHPIAGDLWQRVGEKAKADLRLADVEGQQLLSVGEARVISVSVRPDLARTLLQATDVRGRLLHCAFDEDKEARKALKELGCEEIHDQNLIEAIAEKAYLLSTDTKWIWACWEWLAAWVGKEPYGDKHKERVERIKELPLLPVDSRLQKLSDLAGRIVTWKPDGRAGNLPDWLPLTFVENWFRDSIQALTDQDHAVKKLCAELDIDEPGEDIIQHAVGRAIAQYWKDRQGDPERFLRFILEQDWYETSKASFGLQRCPVPISQPVQGEVWVEAGKAYFGREWGNDLVADLYASIETAAWVRNDGREFDHERRHGVLVWLGVADCPRVVKESGETDVWQLQADCSGWKRYLDVARDYWGRRVEKISAISEIDHLAVGGLNSKQAVSLVRLIAKHWDEYYANEREITAQGRQSREQYYRSWQVKARWWWEVCEQLRLPRRDGDAEHVALMALWLPDKRTERAIGDLLRVIDLDAFGNDKSAVHDWLIRAASLRTRIEQLTAEEFKELLSTRIPAKAPAERLVSDERLRDNVTRWYASCLETVAEEENVPQGAFASCPLLCRKADSWRYVDDEPRYLGDDNDLAKAFAGDLWLFQVPARLTADAVKYLAVRLLSESVQVVVMPREPRSPLFAELQERFSESLPYTWAWRSSQSKQDAERLSAHLKGLKVYAVPALRAHLEMDGVHHEVERRWHVEDDTVFLHSEHANEAELAQALAKALDVRSEADFYENLLRCKNDDQRKEKLLSKGIADDEVERCLREYSGRPSAEEQEQEEHPKDPTKRSAEDITPRSPSAPDNKAQQHKSTSDEPQEKTPEKPQEPPGASKQPRCLKNIETVDFVIGTPPQGGPEIGGGGGGGGGGGLEGHALTDEEKAKLEEAGRHFATRELKNLGYTVEAMPLDNPGFDLGAKKGGEELRVEVKAHKGRVTVVDVTQRQYKEYLGQQEYRWELWNVEHLVEADTEPVVITRYADMPDEALDARTFRVDLKKCHSPSNPPSKPD